MGSLGKCARVVQVTFRIDNMDCPTEEKLIRSKLGGMQGIKLVFLALAGMATLWVAVFADVGASLLVIANGLRLLMRQ
ncbi:hypothetical protein [Nitrincola alkalilacustris]|uniref:hypothetical protein n=1 Tax=Nitrincola alkalilacustris TaxID=1571224 RepID=UPI00197ED461|nr:hypothetical protein [Nitrincola alkalilacustris]